MGEVPKGDWMESVQLVFDYFCERTPRSFVETRETSVVWNYKYADNEFGRIQVRCRWAVQPCMLSSRQIAQPSGAPGAGLGSGWPGRTL